MSQATQTNAPKKRKQISRACGNCRQSKTACDEGRPCARCIARNIGHTCVDAPKKKRTKKADMIHKKSTGSSPAKKRKLSVSPESPPEMIAPAPLSLDPPMSAYSGMDRPSIYLPNSHTPPTTYGYTSSTNANPTNPSPDPMLRMRSSPGTLPLKMHDGPVVLPSLQIDSPERPPSLESVRTLGVFDDDPMPMMRTASVESEKHEEVDTSSTPFLSLNPHQRGSFTRDSTPRLPPLSSNHYELPFRTVAEPSVDLFSDGPGPHNSRRSNVFSFSDDSLGFSGVRKTPSLEALLKSVLSEIKKGEQGSSLSDLYKNK